MKYGKGTNTFGPVWGIFNDGFDAPGRDEAEADLERVKTGCAIESGGRTIDLPAFLPAGAVIRAPMDIHDMPSHTGPTIAPPLRL